MARPALHRSGGVLPDSLGGLDTARGEVYGTGMPTTDTTSCTCPTDARHPYECVDCPIHGAEAEAECRAEQEAECAAENAWLRAAEAGTAEDYAFERYESEMGLL